MSAIFIGDPGRNVIEFDAYAEGTQDEAKPTPSASYANHP